MNSSGLPGFSKLISSYDWTSSTLPLNNHPSWGCPAKLQSSRSSRKQLVLQTYRVMVAGCRIHVEARFVRPQFCLNGTLADIVERLFEKLPLRKSCSARTTCCIVFQATLQQGLDMFFHTVSIYMSHVLPFALGQNVRSAQGSHTREPVQRSFEQSDGGCCEEHRAWDTLIVKKDGSSAYDICCSYMIV